MTTEQPASLAAFFVFNPTLGEEQTEGRKNLFFHPNIDVNRMKDYIGLSEGIINFTRDFSPDKPCEALRCEKTRHAFFECEKDYWIVLIMNNPSIVKSRNGTPVYLEDELGDSCLQAIVKRTYATFRMCNGRMADIARQHSYEFLKTKLWLFMKYFLPTIDFQNVRFLMDIRGFNFMPVNRNAFLMTQYIINVLSSAFPSIASCAVMYDRKLIWSGLEQDDMFFLYLLDQKNMGGFFKYLATNPEKPSGEQDPSGENDADIITDMKSSSTTTRKANTKEGLARKSIGFLTGPAHILDHSRSAAPQLHLKTFDWKRKRLAVYRYSSITLFMVMHDVAMETSDYQEIDKYARPDIQKLEALLSRQGGQDSKPSDSYRFLYFNALNLALVSTLGRENTQPVSMETIKLIRKIHKDFRINPWGGYGFADDGKKRLEDEGQKTKEGNSSDKDIKGKNNGETPSTPEKSEAKSLSGGPELVNQNEAEVSDSKESEPQRADEGYSSDAGDRKQESSNRQDEDSTSKNLKGGDPIHVVVKTKADGWLVASKATQTQREFFVLVDHKNANLTTVQEEVNRLARSYFAKIFMH
mmetsp:Transcript_1187/g.1692  ORF Transcript_1187/g.1692 Transcript_1187/m.1692 type:complete len:583 (+) Transcript_1187:70-1818(+)